MSVLDWNKSGSKTENFLDKRDTNFVIINVRILLCSRPSRDGSPQRPGARGILLEMPPCCFSYELIKGFGIETHFVFNFKIFNFFLDISCYFLIKWTPFFKRFFGNFENNKHIYKINLTSRWQSHVYKYRINIFVRLNYILNLQVKDNWSEANEIWFGMNWCKYEGCLLYFGIEQL